MSTVTIVFILGFYLGAFIGLNILARRHWDD